MKQISVIALSLAISSSAFAQRKSDTFTGQIMDKQCAQMNSHENMLKSEGAKNAKECTIACVKSGGAFALLDSQTKTVYSIEDEKKVREYAGERVQITGKYDDDAGILRIKTITRAR
jgi:hypothetical protein